MLKSFELIFGSVRAAGLISKQARFKAYHIYEISTYRIPLSQPLQALQASLAFLSLRCYGSCPAFIAIYHPFFTTLGYKITLPVPGPGFRDLFSTKIGRKPNASGRTTHPNLPGPFAINLKPNSAQNRSRKPGPWTGSTIV